MENSKIGTIINKDRHKLQEVIPLNTPYTIFIDPSNLCNFKCEFCAAHSIDSNLIDKKCMSIELFKKIINDLCEFKQKIKILRITGQGEPLINKYLPEMIRYAKKKDVADFIEIITNGSLFCEENIDEIIDSGVDRIRISVEGINKSSYEEVIGRKFDFDNFVKNIELLYKHKKSCEIYIKTVDVSVKTEADQNKFYNLFQDKCDKIFIEKITPLWAEFDELNISTDKGVHGEEAKDIKVCPYIFYSFFVNTNGQVTCCCADWKRRYIIGDVNNESLLEIWNGNKLRSFWKDMLFGNKDKYLMCKKCTKPNYDCKDNIDDYANDILKKIE